MRISLRTGVGVNATLALLCCLAVTACTRVDTTDTSSSPVGARHSWTVPDTLRVGMPFVPRTLNPLLSTTTGENMINTLFADKLVTVDAHGNFVPDLAKEVPTEDNGDISADGLTIRYRLRENVKWHDGVPFTSKDVKFSFDALMNPNNDIISRHGYDVVQSVETPDDYTIVFHLKRKFAPFIATVFSESDSPYMIIPEHILGKEKSINNVAFNSAPIGTGPFKFVRWLRGDHLEFTRNDDYFLGKPKIKNVIVKLIPDENTLITQTRTHEIDWFYEATVNAYKSLRDLSNVRLVLTPYNGYYGLMFNNKHGATSDLRVRKAILYAIDKAQLARNLTFGAADVATQDLPSFLWAYNKALAPTPYNVQAAKSYLADAGYGPNHRLSLELYYEQSSVLGKLAAVQIQETLHDLGIDVRIHSQLTSVIYAGYGANGTLARGKYDLALYPWIAGIDPDDSAQFTCSNLPPAGYNQSQYCSKAMDAAEETALNTYDQTARAIAYARTQQQLAKDVPMDFLFWQRQVQAVNPDLHGFDPNPVTEDWDIYRWSI
jgi:peptide/nickel transport system substrate-binding protein